MGRTVVALLILRPFTVSLGLGAQQQMTSMMA
jgi:hypothetical protein